MPKDGEGFVLQAETGCNEFTSTLLATKAFVRRLVNNVIGHANGRNFQSRFRRFRVLEYPEPIHCYFSSHIFVPENQSKRRLFLTKGLNVRRSLVRPPQPLIASKGESQMTKIIPPNVSTRMPINHHQDATRQVMPAVMCTRKEYI